MARLTAEIRAEEENLERLKAALGDVSAETLKGDLAVQHYYGSIAQLRAELAAVRSAGSAAKSGMSEAASATAAAGEEAGKAGQKILDMGRLLDDLQYVPQQGLRPIINNVMELAPAIGIAMIAIQTLISNWEALSKLWSQGGTRTEAQEMEELAKNTAKTADELARLNTLKERHAQIEAVGSVKSSDRELAERRFDQGVKAAGGSDKVLGEVAASLTAGGEDGLSKVVGGDSYERYVAAKRALAEKDWRKRPYSDATYEKWMKEAKERNKLAVDEEAHRIAADARQGGQPGEANFLNRLTPRRAERSRRAHRRGRTGRRSGPRSARPSDRSARGSRRPSRSR